MRQKYPDTHKKTAPKTGAVSACLSVSPKGQSDAAQPGVDCRCKGIFSYMLKNF